VELLGDQRDTDGLTRRIAHVEIVAGDVRDDAAKQRVGLRAAAGATAGAVSPIVAMNARKARARCTLPMACVLHSACHSQPGM